jgi:thiol-disulfide isomerase/thioredoxin
MNVDAKRTKQDKLKIGEVPPSYVGTDTNGDKVNLEDYLGKVIVVSFWASWCSPCLQELPILENLQAKVGVDKIKVVAVNYKESRKVYHQIKTRLSDVTMTLTHDKTGLISSKYGVKTLPNLFIIGKDGKLSHHMQGYGDKSIDKIIEAITAEYLKDVQP